jgi:hypothetical protein
LNFFINGGALQQDNGKFGAFPNLMGPQWLYGMMSDLDQTGGLPEPLGFASFSQYLGMRTQVDTLFKEGFYQSQISNGFSDSHFSYSGAANIGTTMGDIMRGASVAASLAFTQQPASADVGVVVGDADSPAVVVTVTDQFGSADSLDSSMVTLTNNHNADVLVSPAISGVATFTSLTFNSPGTYSLIAMDGSLPGAVSAGISVTGLTGLSGGAGTAYLITGPDGGPQILDVTAGTLTVSIDLSIAAPNYGLTIENGAQVVLNSDQHVAGLNLIGNGTIDLGTHFLNINYGSNASPNATIPGYIASAYANGLWTGTGITSSWVRANRTVDAIGFADGADGVVRGLASGQYLIRPTVGGDANLDGVTDFNDFVLLSTHFLKADNRWNHGNFNFDAFVDFNDFIFISHNFLFTTGLPQDSVNSNSSNTIAP